MYKAKTADIILHQTNETITLNESKTMNFGRSKILYTECFENGKPQELVVTQFSCGTVSIDLHYDGMSFRIYEGTIESAREAYRKYKAKRG